MSDLTENENQVQEEYQLTAKEKFIEKITLIFCLVTCAAFFLKIVIF